ncbi:MAG: alpha/beta hydrolase [Mycoplasma sp.]|nr:alpha/beta hydrolase [Mycoplasma sp.]
MEKRVLEIQKQKYACLYWKGTKKNDVAIVYYHGLNGKSKLVKPLLSKLNEYDFYSVESRGHENSYQKASTRPKKHVQDIKNVIDCLKLKYKKIFLCGESMGGLYTSLYGYKYDEVDGIFCWSIPFHPRDIMKERKAKKIIIFTRVFLCFLFGWNYLYSAKVDYPKLTNSKFLMKINELDINTKGSTSEEISIWKASLKIKRLFLHKKPKTVIYYWQGENDIMSSNKLLRKIQRKNKITANEVPNSKHILMYEDNFNYVTKTIIKYIESSLD